MDPVVEELCWSVDQEDSKTREVVDRVITYPRTLCFPNCNKPLISVWFLVHCLIQKVPKGRCHCSLYSALWQDFTEPLSLKCLLPLPSRTAFYLSGRLCFFLSMCWRWRLQVSYLSAPLSRVTYLMSQKMFGLFPAAPLSSGDTCAAA